MYDHLLTLLDSRAARMTPQQALLSLHADYIGGEHANYRIWYFAAQLDLDMPSQQKTKQPPLSSASGQYLQQMKREWHDAMVTMTDHDRMSQLVLYLLIWGEASTLRYMPELLCFLFKLAEDHRKQMDNNSTSTESSHHFLNDIVAPLYRFLRDQSYIIVNGQCLRREKDHNDIIGYDDVNQFFWDRRAMARLLLKDGVTLLKDIPQAQRYEALPFIDWSSAFRKTFYESRSWLHLFTNFSRFWVLHIATFWYYMTANMGFLLSDYKHYTLPVKLSVVGLGGLVAVALVMAATISEFHYLPAYSHITKILITRLLCLILLAAGHTGAFFYVYYMDSNSMIALIVSSCQLGLGVIVTIILAIVPSSRLFRLRNQLHLATQAFTAHFPTMSSDDRFLSILMWLCIFTCKFLETYFFQALSFRDAITAMATLKFDICRRDPLLGNWICTLIHVVASILMFAVELILFFLDTYLWYVIWNTVFSVSQAMRLGISIMTSWRTMFARLPGNMYSKITATREFSASHLRKMACSQMWNAIVISMYREHLLSINNLHWLMYKIYNKTTNDDDDDGDDAMGTRGLALPAIFDLDNNVNKDDCFPAYSEAERRLSFFAQSLSADIPPPCSVQQMPIFTVFTPHYAEKILLSLREIIREEDTTTRVTLLEYLKRLHRAEWHHFVKDTKFIAEEDDVDISGTHSVKDKDDLPFYCIGFKSSAPEYTLRTRVWASLRAQTLYRTVSGFMNYARALKILHRIERPELSDINNNKNTSNNLADTETHLDQLAQHKFRFLVAMQRYDKFNDEENENCEYLLTEFPHLQIAYIEEQMPTPSNTDDHDNDDDYKDRQPNEPTYYSCLIDGFCPKLPNNRRKPRCRIQLPGNPILGDGKSDNQNHAIIFSRGEYLQLVDANQDNYLEECLKIRSIFREFEQDGTPTQDVYAYDDDDDDDNKNTSTTSSSSSSTLSTTTTTTTTTAAAATTTTTTTTTKKRKPPVAIVGAREYIFSENVGVLGDIAAGKEQTFGTLTQRIMAKTGGRLHYGHPDFLNAVFMTTRGGVSKAQRGLHLNEDIYAGMNALSRGGRIKHTEYLQCGKGRDLGFCSILNFTTKIGTGMGEQLLSREYYYLGTQLPLDRFLTFYYAHPGFHMNNIMIIFAIQIFLFCMMVIGTMAVSLPHCPSQQVTRFTGCLDATPIYDWLRRCILSIFMVFFIAFLPLFLQELTEKGTSRSLARLLKQLVSLSPFFEVFVTQIYANAVLSNLSFGGARYIATGRGFATSRLPFSVLYSRFANPSIYFGARTMFMLLFISLAVWIPHLIYFWATVSALIFSPFIFNPHQFVWTEFINDYRHFLSWFIRGNARHYHGDAWITYCRQSRTRVIGTRHHRKQHKKKKKKKMQEKELAEHTTTTSVPMSPKARLASIFVSEIFMPMVQAGLCLVMYSFCKSRDGLPMGPGGGIARIGLITLSPMIGHAILLACVQIITLVLACLGCGMGRWMAAITHSLGILLSIGALEFFWWMENYATQPTLLGLLAVFAMQRFIFKTIVAIFLTRELPDDATNRAWWNGNWRRTKLGKYALREYICKIVEMSVFTTDFILGHLILFVLFPVCCIPYIDRLHSLMLFWLRPSHQIRPSVLSTKQRQRRNQVILWYGPLFILIFILFVSLLVVPLLFWQPRLPRATSTIVTLIF
ncbi:glycosyltransferase family 48 protein [Halteromyces radiatus]|uniref:glycosyltransferase family 48 protein n=1 Tax=Halteromyces radiatus TaxID=101107 RepID=UPI002220A9F2|nr:glycosyltransferase family 48 protein [Halteromyces radiatus]KAI8098520.1 glycosyltransferase family 48 protein [Halteromyces radiatus]